MTAESGARSPLCICYHGTTTSLANRILQQGFRAGTYFALHLEDALTFGGLHIFEVSFTKCDLPNGWQFRIAQAVSTKQIVRLRKFVNPRELFSNVELREKVFESNTGEEL